MKPLPGKVYLIPCPLQESALYTIPAYVKEQLKNIRYFFVEEERSARRYIKAMDRSVIIDELTLLPVNEHISPDLRQAQKWLQAGEDIGIISEAGCPGVADPGNLIVQVAHRIGAVVIPLVGPNAILLALMASGMNGQHFLFNGYIPIKQPARSRAIRLMEQAALQNDQTQIFMETPYRNNQLLQDLVKECKASTFLCIAADITGPQQLIRTASIGEWKEQLPDIHKKPAIFLLGRPF